MLEKLNNLRADAAVEVSFDGCTSAFKGEEILEPEASILPSPWTAGTEA